MAKEAKKDPQELTVEQKLKALFQQMCIRDRDASIAYGNDVLFSNFNLQLKRGEIASISGSSRCGTTSLLNAILGFTPLKEGRITVNDIVSDKKSIDLILSLIHISLRKPH